MQRWEVCDKSEILVKLRTFRTIFIYTDSYSYIHVRIIASKYMHAEAEELIVSHYKQLLRERTISVNLHKCYIEEKEWMIVFICQVSFRRESYLWPQNKHDYEFCLEYQPFGQDALVLLAEGFAFFMNHIYGLRSSLGHKCLEYWQGIILQAPVNAYICEIFIYSKWKLCYLLRGSKSLNSYNYQREKLVNDYNTMVFKFRQMTQHQS